MFIVWKLSWKGDGDLRICVKFMARKMSGNRNAALLLHVPIENHLAISYGILEPTSAGPQPRGGGFRGKAHAAGDSSTHCNR